MIKVGDSVWVRHEEDSWIPGKLVNNGPDAIVTAEIETSKVKIGENISVKRNSSNFASMGYLNVKDCDLDGTHR